MTSLPSITPTLTPKTPKTFYKCDNCRTRKIKCIPIARDFSRGQKCDDCASRGLPCGPNTRVGKQAQSPVVSQLSTPVPAAYSPVDLFAGCEDALGSPVVAGDARVLQRHNIASPSPSVSFTQSLPNSQSVESQSIPVSLTHGSFQWALKQLCFMGWLVELYAYCQQRSTALNNMQASLPLHDVQIFSTALDFLVAVLGHLMLTALRHVVHLQSQLTLLERELVRRRAFDTGLRFIRYSHTSDRDKRQSSSFEEAFEGLRAELVTFYRSCGDHAEANCISTSTLKVQPYLNGFSFDMLSRLSAELCNVLQYAFKDINPKYQDVLDPKKCVRIDTSHLAILSGRMNNTIKPDKCGITMQPDITGRNELHLAVETGDLCYLEWTLNNRQRYTSFDLEKRDTFGFTPLMIAAYVGCLEIFRLLLREGANVKAQLATGRSILSLASMAGHEGIVAEILVHGVKIQDCIEFCSPIHDAAATGRSEAVVKLLLSNKAEPRDERTEHGNRSASQIAFANKHHNIASILLEAEKALEKKLPTKDPHGRTIESLKRLIGQEMARSNSPESPAASRMGRASSPDSGRVRKRHKSVSSDWQAAGTITGSASSTPRAHSTVVPSPLGQTIVGSYSVRTFSNLESDIVGLPMDDYIISPHDAEYDAMFDMP